MGISISGQCASGYEAVKEAFQIGFEEDAEMGAALSIWRDGREVVSLHAGYADSRRGKLWDEDTAAVIFSCTKGLMSILAAQLVQDGLLDYHRPVADYWPEFAANGKDQITVADVLSHQAGLSALRNPAELADILNWHPVVERLAAQAPLWQPGTGYAYHALTHGWLVGEIVRRISGQSVGDLFRSRISGPLKANAWIGLPADEAHRVAHIRCIQSLVDFWASEAAKDQTDSPHWPYRAMTLGNALPPSLITENSGFNDPRLHEAEIPGAGGIATASALASIWSATVTDTMGVQLLNDDMLDAAIEPVSGGKPIFPVPGPYPRYGMGFQLDSPARRYLTEHSFGHDGAGGQVVFADKANRLSFAYITNWMIGMDDPRGTRIIDALKSVL